MYSSNTLIGSEIVVVVLRANKEEMFKTMPFNPNQYNVHPIHPPFYMEHSRCVEYLTQ